MILVDQITKLLALIVVNGTIEIFPGFLSLRVLRNTGISFGIPINDEYALALKITTGIFLLAFAVYYSLKKDQMPWVQELGFEFVIAGGIGNAIDRLIYGGVIDFISFSLFGYNLFVCNFADIFITVGAILLILHFWFRKPPQNDHGYKNLLFKEHGL